MSLSNKLYRTNFFVQVFTLNQKFTFNHLRISIDTGENHLDIGTESEKFAKKILFSFIDFTKSLDLLEEIPVFLQIKSVPKFYLKNGISEINYYKYHLENHYIKITSILDYTAAFVNNVYRLGIPSRKCNIYALTENLNLKQTEVGKILHDFESHFKDIKRKRNLIIHEGKYENEQLKKLDSTLISDSFLKSEKILAEWFVERKKHELNKIISMLIDNQNSICEYLIKLLDNLLPVFYDSYNFLKTKEIT